VDNNTGLATNQSAIYTCANGSTSVPLCFTLVWTDYPGSTTAARAIVNQLDFVVTAPDGSTYSGNGTTDRINNVQEVDFSSPTLGVYTVTITGYNVPQGPQPFALVVSGNLTHALASGYIVTPSAGSNGSISPNTAQRITSGSSVSFTATPNSGYTVNDWTVDGTVAQTGGTQFILSSVTTNHTVQVTFTTQSAPNIVLAGLASNGSIWYTTDLQTWNNAPGELSSLVIGDFNGDGYQDMAGRSGDDSVWYTADGDNWINTMGHLTFLTVGTFPGSAHNGLAGVAASDSIWYTSNLSTWTSVPGSLTTLVSGKFKGSSTSGLAGLSSDDGIWYTTDMTNWTNIPGTLKALVDGQFNDSSNYGLAGLADDGSIWYTKDLATWTNVPGNLQSIVAGRFGSSGDGIAGLAADSSIWYTTDMTNWTSIPGHLDTLIAADLNAGTVDGLAGTASDGSIWYTLDLANWKQIPGTLSSLAASHR
jgi:hypothetical protein